MSVTVAAGVAFRIHLCLLKHLFIFFKAINIFQTRKLAAALIGMCDQTVTFLRDIYVTFRANRARGPAKRRV